VYLGNHDQIGNRAQGDRPGAKLSIGRAKIAAALVLTSPFVPMIFQGEEWGASTPFLYFTDHDDPDVARAVSHGRRAEFAAFGWPAESVPDPQHESTFARSRLDWSELHLAPHADLLAWYRTLTRLRRWLPEIVTAPTRVECNERDGTLMVRRGSLRVACNLGETPVALPGEADQVMLLGSSEGIECKPDVLRLPPDAVALTGEASRLPAMLRSACCRERCDGLVAHKVAKPG
jgi:maltooligosyltrehalose trehalohydrolase